MKYYYLVLLLAAAINTQAQGLGVNNSGATAHSSAMLDVSATDKGMLAPRMTIAERNAIASPATGLFIYQTDSEAGFYHYDGSTWTRSGLPEGTGGDILYHNGTAWVKLPAGTVGQVLTMGSGGNPVWASTTAATPPEVGASYGGGTLAYILQSGDPGYVDGETHGLIAAPSDQSTSIPWGCVGFVLGGTVSTFGAGPANTTIVSAGCGAGTAAQLCADLVLGGYDDWYLPSQAELLKLYINRTIIGGFDEAAYWSSTETSTSAARGYIFGGPTSGSGDGAKNFGSHVRAVRTF